MLGIGEADTAILPLDNPNLNKLMVDYVQSITQNVVGRLVKQYADKSSTETVTQQSIRPFYLGIHCGSICTGMNYITRVRVAKMTRNFLLAQGFKLLS